MSGTTVPALVLGRLGQKNEKNGFERYGQKNKNKKKYKGSDALDRRCLLSGRFLRSHWASFSHGRVSWVTGFVCHRSARTGFRAVTTPLLLVGFLGGPPEEPHHLRNQNL